MPATSRKSNADLRSYARLTFQTTDNTFQVVNQFNVKEDIFVTKKPTPGQNKIVSALILGVSTAKNLVNSSGVFSIDLSPRIIKSQSVNLGTSYLPDIIKPFNLVQIDFKVDDSGYHTEMIGFVTRASVKTTIQEDGTPSRVFHIEGCDLTKALQTYMMYFNPYIFQGAQANYNGILYGMSKDGQDILNQNNAADFTKKFIQYAINGVAGTSNGISKPYFGFYFNPKFKGFINPAQEAIQSGIRLDALIDFSSCIGTEFSQLHMTNPLILTQMASEGEKSLWAIMKEYSDAPFHEAFLDLRRPFLNNSSTQNKIPNLDNTLVNNAEATHDLEHIKPTDIGNPNTMLQQPYCFYMRTAPFSSKNWNNLNLHYFSTADILAVDVSTSEESIYNYYEVNSTLEQVMQDKYQMWPLSGNGSYNFNGTNISRIPIFDYQSILTYGLRRFKVKTKYVDFVNGNNENGQPSVGNIATAIKAQATLIRELFRWFSFGEDFESGTIVLKGRVGIGPWGATIGSRLVELFPKSGTINPTGKEYYIECVSQTYELGRPLITSLNVTRGHYPNGYSTNGTTIVGRFKKVSLLEKAMKIDQGSAGNLFFPIPE